MKRDTIHLGIETTLWGGEDLRDWVGKDVIESVKCLGLDYKDWVNFTDRCHWHWIFVFKSLLEVDVTVWGENKFSEGERRKGLLRVFEGQLGWTLQGEVDAKKGGCRGRLAHRARGLNPTSPQSTKPSEARYYPPT